MPPKPLESLPPEVFLENLFPLLPTKDLLNLFTTNKFFANLGQDDTFWKSKLQIDYNFSNISSARRKGFKFVYSRLSKPKVFVWGSSGEGRLGQEMPLSNTKTIGNNQLYPLELTVGGGRIVDLAAGGWSFVAKDSEGNLYVWGQMENGYSLSSDGFAHPSKKANKPAKLQMPNPIKIVSCGRSFMTALDITGKIWCFNCWGRPFHYKPAAFESTSGDFAVVQVESGWSFAAALTAGGSVYVWNPGQGVMQKEYEEKYWDLDLLQGENGQPDARGLLEDGVIKCYPWTMTDIEPLLLPELPTLPKLSHIPEDDDHQPKLVKIAAGDHFMVGLTDKGHVLKIDLWDVNAPEALIELGDDFREGKKFWEFLPGFCDVNSVTSFPAFSSGEVKPPITMEITHISAHFLTFVTYSTGDSSIVLMGDNHTTPTSEPKIIPSLQHRGVISVVLGDWHFGALLEDGKLLGWGAVDCIGMGDPFLLKPGQPGAFDSDADKERARTIPVGRPEVKEPTEIRFDHGQPSKRDYFIFGATASGWHMGALAIDLDEDGPQEIKAEVKDEDPEVVPSPPNEPTIHPNDPPSLGTPVFPFIIRGRGGAFVPRIGFAGRGATRGLPRRDEQSEN